MRFFELVCTDLTNLGGPMGTESTSEIFRKAFTSVLKAKVFAEKDHNKRDRRSRIKWEKGRRKYWYSGDLLSHSYEIHNREVQ